MIVDVGDWRSYVFHKQLEGSSNGPSDALSIPQLIVSSREQVFLHYTLALSLIIFLSPTLFFSPSFDLFYSVLDGHCDFNAS